MNQRLLLGLTTFFLVVFAYASALRALLRPLVGLPDITGGMTGQTLVLVLFSLTHAFYALGWRHTLVFFGSSAVISWVYEQIGVATGLVYGPHSHNGGVGGKFGAGAGV